jgi:hypothetical protein
MEITVIETAQRVAPSEDEQELFIQAAAGAWRVNGIDRLNIAYPKQEWQPQSIISVQLRDLLQRGVVAIVAGAKLPNVYNVRMQMEGEAGVDARRGVLRALYGTVDICGFILYDPRGGKMGRVDVNRMDHLGRIVSGSYTTSYIMQLMMMEKRPVEVIFTGEEQAQNAIRQAMYALDAWCEDAGALTNDLVYMFMDGLGGRGTTGGADDEHQWSRPIVQKLLEVRMWMDPPADITGIVEPSPPVYPWLMTALNQLRGTITPINTSSIETIWGELYTHETASLWIRMLAVRRWLPEMGVLLQNMYKRSMVNRAAAAARRNQQYEQAIWNVAMLRRLGDARTVAIHKGALMKAAERKLVTQEVKDIRNVYEMKEQPPWYHSLQKLQAAKLVIDQMRAWKEIKSVVMERSSKGDPKDWITSAEGSIIMCPHQRDRYLMIEKTGTFDPAKLVHYAESGHSDGSFIYCGICGASIGRRIDDITYMLPEGEESADTNDEDPLRDNLWRQSNQIIRGWIEFANPVGERAMTSFIARVVDVLMPLIIELQSMLNKNRTIAEQLREQQLRLFTAVYVYAMVMRIVADHPGHVLPRRMVGGDADDGEEMEPEMAVTVEHVDELDTVDEGAERATPVGKSAQRQNKPTAGNLNKRDNRKGKQNSKPNLFIWALDALQQSYAGVIKKLTGVTRDVLERYLRAAYSRLQLYIANTSIQNMEPLENNWIYDDPQYRIAQDAWFRLGKRPEEIPELILGKSADKILEVTRITMPEGGEKQEEGRPQSACLQEMPWSMIRDDRSGVTHSYNVKSDVSYLALYVGEGRWAEGHKRMRAAGIATGDNATVPVHFHKWNVYQVDGKIYSAADVSAAGFWKTHYNVQDHYCSICCYSQSHILKSKLNPIPILNNQYDQSNFFNYYTYMCPEISKDIHSDPYHSYVDDKCSKCGVTYAQLQKQDSAYYGKYKGSLLKMMEQNIAIGEIEEVGKAPKVTKAPKESKSGKWQPKPGLLDKFVQHTYSSVQQIQSKIKLQTYRVVIQSLGITKQYIYEYILNGSVVPQFTDSMADDRNSTLDGYTADLLNQYNLLRNHKQMVHVSPDIKSIGGRLNRALPELQYAGKAPLLYRDEIMPQFANQNTKRSEFAMQFLIELLLLTEQNITSVSSASVGSAFTILNLRRILNSEKFFSKLSEAEEAEIASRAKHNDLSSDSSSAGSGSGSDNDSEDEGLYGHMDYDGDNDD